MKRKPAPRTSQDKGKPADDAGWVKRREQLLDEALAESFPASDPPSIIRPHRRQREQEP